MSYKASESASTGSSGTLAERFATDDADRTLLLNRARLCAALTIPWILPPLSQTADTELPEAYQSIGAWGLSNLTSGMHTALFPPLAPWFQFSLAPEILYNPKVPNEKKQAFLDDFYLQQLIVQGMLDSSHLDDAKRDNRRARGFYATKHTSLLQLNITGDTLEHMGDDYRSKYFRRDQYVAFRDSCGDLLYTIVKECVDPMSSLTEKQRIDSGLKDERFLPGNKRRSARDRMEDLFTVCEWQPWTKTWVIRQEVKGKTINESEETVSPYIATPYNLAGGEHYGRGFVEMNLGDLRSLNNLELRILDFAALCSDMMLALDAGCEADDEDCKGPSGRVRRGFRVVDGKVVDAAWFKVDKYPDFRVVHATAERKHQNLARAMQIESEITPSKERTTAAQVNRVAAQVQGATGGMYAPISEEQHSLVRRLVFQCRRDGFIPKLPDKAAKLDILTGLAALARQSKLGNILQFADVVARLGPDLQARIKPGVLMATIARYANVYEPGMIKTDAEMAAETQARMKNEAQLAAINKTTDVVGNVAEAGLTQQATGVTA